MRLFGFDNPQMDVAAQGPLGYAAIRGREQQLIDFYGGIGNPQVGNRIRGVAKWNKLGRYFWLKSNDYFFNISPYTGY